MPIINAVEPGSPGAYTPHGGAKEFLRCRDFQVFLCGGTETGKMQPLSATIMTPRGPKTLRQLAEGDEVIAYDGTTARITGYFPQGVQKVYHLFLSDGTRVDAGAEHLWTIRQYPEETYKVVSTTYLYQLLKAQPDTLIALPPGRATEFAPDLVTRSPIPYYSLAILILAHAPLRDCPDHALLFCNIPAESLARMQQELAGRLLLVPNDTIKSPKGHKYHYLTGRPSLMTWLKQELRDLYATRKALRSQRLHHIFKNYITEAPLTDRLDFLAGVLDYSATCLGPKEPSAELRANQKQYQRITGWHLKLKTLALEQSVAELIRSTGGVAQPRRGGPIAKNQSYGRITVHYRSELRKPAPLRARLREFFHPSLPFQTKRFIRYVEKGTFSTEMACIKIDHPSELYLTDHYIPTHNTTACCVKIHLLAMLYPGCEILMARQNYSALVKTAVKTYRRVISDMGYHNLIETIGGTKPTQFIYPYAKRTDPRSGKVFQGRSTIVLGNLDKASDHLGAEYDFIYINQPEETQDEVWEYLTTRATGRKGTAPYEQMFGDPNPAHKKHWILRGAEAGRWRIIKSLHKDNPRLWDHERNDWTPAGAVTMDRLKKSMTGARYQRFVEGEWADTEGLVYGGAWDELTHIIPRTPFWDCPPKEWKRYWGIDFGMVAPFVWSCWAEDPASSKLYRYKLIYHTDRTIDEHAETIRREIMKEGVLPHLIVTDREPQSARLLQEALQLQTVTAYKGPNSVISGINLVTSFLKEGRIAFVENSLVEEDPRLIKDKLPIGFEQEVMNYRWSTIPDVPVKDCDHECDAVRYLLMALYGNEHSIDVIWK